MPSRLKSLELHGYKTFAARTEFTFADMITAIVGPNGSGKSNIADAIRWVLGEQSYSLLRAKKTEDMIFSGSEQKPRSGMASASIVFDNGDGWLPIDFADVAITRRAYRDGQNEYLINGQRVRLKDVSELLAQSGLAERTYTIIGQGLVDAALALRAEERRRLFEEAAGIGLHRTRKEEALRRLESTRRNLERVQDILAELQPRLRSLERQARRVREYEQAKADLNAVLKEWYGYHWHRIQKELADAQILSHNHEVVLEQARQKQEGLNREMMELVGKISEQRDRIGMWHRELSEFHSKKELIGRDLVVAEERLRSIANQQNDIAGEINRLEEEAGLQEELLYSVDGQIQALQNEYAESGQKVKELQVAINEKQSIKEEAEARLQEARQGYSTLTARKEYLSTIIEERTTVAERNTSLLYDIQSMIKKIQLEKQQAEARFVQAESSVKQIEVAYESAREKENGLRRELDLIDQEKKGQTEVLTESKTNIASFLAQLNVLAQADSTLTGYTSGARLLLQAVQQSRLPGVAGALSSMIEVEAEYEIAIASALGEFLDAVLFTRAGDIEVALQMLEGTSARSALLSLDIENPFLDNDHRDFLNRFTGIVGLAFDLVSVPEKIKPLIRLILGQVVVVDTRANARQLLDGLLLEKRYTWRVVTLRGELFHVAGGILAGQESKPGTLSRPRERRVLQASLEDERRSTEMIQQRLGLLDEQEDETRAQLALVVEEVRNLSLQFAKAREIHSKEELAVQKAAQDEKWNRDQVTRLRSDITNGLNETKQMEKESILLEGQIEEARKELRTRITTLADTNLDEIQNQLAHWNTRQAVVNQALADAVQRRKEFLNSLEKTHAAIVTLKGRSQEFENHLQSITIEKEQAFLAEGQLNLQISALQDNISPAEQELKGLERLYTDLQTRESFSRQVLSNAEHQHAQARITLARRQEAVASLQTRIEDDFGLVSFRYAETISGQTTLPLEGLVEQLPVVAEIPSELEENVRRFRAQLRRIGPVNPEIQEEYIQVRDRYEFLTEQVADLRKAEEDIKEVIAELDLLMEREFGKTFNAVAQEFRQIFTRLFGGGSARLVLTAPENMAETGIDIEARLPGRREQGLSLLSGGERSLTAAALVFSLLRVSPTPFCVLDEVDAMLDEANVGRFRELLRELSQSTQFVIVTHNRNTVQAADVIYGVTMGQDSTSQVISLKLDDVNQIVD
jgi:chromosome segregation protein